MHDGNDFDPAGSLTKENGKGEGAEQTASDITVYERKEFRVDSDARNAVFKGGEKPFAKVGLFTFVPGGSGDKLDFGLGMKYYRCHCNAA